MTISFHRFDIYFAFMVTISFVSFCFPDQHNGSRCLNSLYFHVGLSYQEILCALAISHRIVISLRTLKRRLRGQHLFGRKNLTDILDVAAFINRQIKESAGSIQADAFEVSASRHGCQRGHCLCPDADLRSRWSRSQEKIEGD